jgi:hypothetical protein
MHPVTFDLVHQRIQVLLYASWEPSGDGTSRRVLCLLSIQWTVFQRVVKSR